jgi:transcriptional antiterminator NusG
MTLELKWYVVHTYSGFEEKARLALLERAKNDGLADRVGEVYVPRVVSESTTKTGKKRKVERTSFPGYILVQLAFDERTAALVKGTPKITGFVGNQKKPTPLTDLEVMRLRNPESVEQPVKVQPQVSFERGEAVKVIDGPFSNFDGVIDESMPDRMKIRVMVTIFGRETPVELEYSQVKKLS